MTTVFVNLAGLAAMVAIVWWFWLAEPDTNADSDQPDHH